MFKKIAAGILAVTVFGAGGAAIAYQATQAESPPAIEETVINPVGLAQGGQPETAGNPDAGTPPKKTPKRARLDYPFAPTTLNTCQRIPASPGPAKCVCQSAVISVPEGSRPKPRPSVEESFER